MAKKFIPGSKHSYFHTDKILSIISALTETPKLSAKVRILEADFVFGRIKVAPGHKAGKALTRLDEKGQLVTTNVSFVSDGYDYRSQPDDLSYLFARMAHTVETFDAKQANKTLRLAKQARKNASKTAPIV